MVTYYLKCHFQTINNKKEKEKMIEKFVTCQFHQSINIFMLSSLNLLIYIFMSIPDINNIWGYHYI